MNFVIKELKEAFSDANIEMVSRIMIKQENVSEVIKEMREDGKFDDAYESDSSGEDEYEQYGQEESKRPPQIAASEDYDG